MGLYLGVDFHARTQTVCQCDTADGLVQQRTLDHRSKDVRAFYQQFPVPANAGLERDIQELLTCPVGRPSHKPSVWYKGFLQQAASWKTARRMVTKAEFHAGELFPRVGSIVTNLETPSRAGVRFYTLTPGDHPQPTLAGRRHEASDFTGDGFCGFYSPALP